MCGTLLMIACGLVVLSLVKWWFEIAWSCYVLHESSKNLTWIYQAYTFCAFGVSLHIVPSNIFMCTWQIRLYKGSSTHKRVLKRNTKIFLLTFKYTLKWWTERASTSHPLSPDALTVTILKGLESQTLMWRALEWGKSYWHILVIYFMLVWIILLRESGSLANKMLTLYRV